MKNLARRMEYLSPHFFASLNSKIATMQASGMDVIRLDEGSPDLPPAPHIIEALVHSAERPNTHSYQPHRGSPILRGAWAMMYRRLYNVEIDPEQEVLPLLGSKEGIFHISQAIIEPGDIALIPDPGYITYTRGTLFAGGEPYYFTLSPENGYMPDLDNIPLSVIKKAKILWLNFPNNPTGAVVTGDIFEKAVAFAKENSILLCHDAAYTQVAFDGFSPPSLLEVPGAKGVAIEFNSLSKSHNMAGWRVAAAIGNPQDLHAFHTLKTNVDSGHFLPILEAATVAMTADQTWLTTRNEVYRHRRDIIIQELHKLGLQASVPKASLYVWCPIPVGWSCIDFTASLLEKSQVSLTPGTLFGKNGEGYVRISLTSPIERINEAMTRLESWMNQWAYNS